MFVNDLHTYLNHGVDIGAKNIKLIMYADDLVVMAENPIHLQRMINELHNYCAVWNLSINLLKSKILIFGKGGYKRAKGEKWKLNTEEIEVVNHYKYLGVELTQNLNYKMHLEDRMALTKQNISITWEQLFKNKDIAISQKYKIFNSISRAIFCYGCQVWGFEMWEETQKLQRYFIKRLAKLPSFSPNYMVDLECGLDPLYLYSLKLHLKYIFKIMQYDENRLPKFLAHEIFGKEISFSKVWFTLAQKTGIDLEGARYTKGDFMEKLEKTLDWLRNEAYNKAIEQAKASSHGLYGSLKYNASEFYFNDCFDQKIISMMFRLRGNLIDLNAGGYKIKSKLNSTKCSLCNLDEYETVIHFICRCPILKSYRIEYFNQTEIEASQVIDLLNGKNFLMLINFTLSAIKYRRKLIHEFNY